MTGSLPEHWTLAPLNAFVKFVGGGTPSKSNSAYWMDGTVPWISPKDIKSEIVEDSADYITEVALASSSTNIVPEGAVLVVTRSGILANKLPVAISGRALAINQDLKALIPMEGISVDYLAYALKRYESHILRDCSKAGTTVPSILTACLQKFEIPLAPSAEQIRIVERIQAALAHVDRIRSAVSDVPTLLLHQRSRLLKAAFNGEATRAWRELNVDGEPPNSLQNTIAKVRSQSALKVETPSQTLCDLFELSEAVPWTFLTLQSICDPSRSITYGIVQTGDETKDGVPIVRAGDIKKFSIDLAALKRVRPETSEQYPRTQLRGGELLISIRGTTGNVAVAGPDMKGMNVSREVAVIPVVSDIEPSYVAYALASPAGQTIINQYVKGVAQSGINLIDLRNFPIPIVSKAEQQEIIAFIEDGFELLNSLEARQQAIADSLNELTAAILRKAFRGELVSQSPNDEPALLLLQRIYAMRTTESKAPRRRTDKPIIGQGDLFRKNIVPRTRKEVDTSHLRSIVSSTSAGSMAVKELYHRADMDVDEFYKQLASEIAQGNLRQNSDKTRLELTDAT